VVTPTGIVQGGLTASDGVITAVGAESELRRGDSDVDCRSMYLLPGLIDPHVHLGIGDGAGPEKMQRDFQTESRDAAVGGVTTMITTTLFGQEERAEVTELAIDAGKRTSMVDFRLTAVVTKREHLAEMPFLTKQGVLSYKFFLGYKGPQAESFGMAPEGISWGFFYEACEALGEADPRAFATIHAEDPYVRDYLTERMRRKPAKNGLLQTWLESSPNILEPMQIYPAALIAHEVGSPVYVVHTSAAESVDLIRDLRDRGWDVYGETLAAFLYWTAEEADARNKGAFAKIQPPIRTARDREALWQGVREGVIASIGTDCQMYPRHTREVDFWDARVGLGPGMGTLLPAVATAAAARGALDFELLARVLAENTARRFGLYPRKGVLQVGSDADVVVVNPKAYREVEAEALETAAGYSLYEGERLLCWPEQVYVRGNLVAEGGEIVASEPVGRYLN
jgi:dihydropyrimidinase/dihydroorotase